MSKYIKPTPEEIAAEEKQAAEMGMTIFAFRHWKKMQEKIKEKNRLKREEKKKERQKAKNIEKGKIKRRKTFEKKRKEKEKIELKEKKQKEREKLKKKKEILAKKRSVGRPRKRGPKINYYKRKKKRLALEAKRNQPKKIFTKHYKIVACDNGKQIKYIGTYNLLENAYEKVKELLSNEIIFPQKLEHRKYVRNAKYEYLILSSNETEKSYLRNEFGKLVEQVTNNDKWTIIDKFPYEVEETFWVWGYNNKTERKTFQWIYDNILVSSIKNQYDIRRIILYKNKIIFMHDDNFMDIIFCKNIEDSVRFYNQLEEFVKRDKIKQIFFIGSYSKISDKRRKLEQQLIDFTGMKKNMIQLSTTFPHLKK